METETMSAKPRRVVKRKYINMDEVRFDLMKTMQTTGRYMHPLDIIEVVCEAANVDMKAITRRKSHQKIGRDVTDATQVAAAQLFIRTPMNIDSIAALVNRDRTSVNYYVMNFAAMRFSRAKNGIAELSKKVEVVLNQMEG